MRRVLGVLSLVTLTVLPSGAQDRDLVLAKQASEGRRLALVIGNDEYTGSPLSNARNDARSMASALRRLSFAVTLIEDGNRLAIGAATLEFGRRLSPSDLAVVFYAGHGVQVEGVNYLIPTDFTGRTEDEVRLNAVSSDELTRVLRRARVGVLVLDACRDNPFSGQRSGSRGLAQLEAQGLLVAFATGAGQTASDGANGNGVFTSELIQLLGTPGRGLRDTFFEVQRRVQTRTEGKQFPAVYSQLVNDVVLTPGTLAPLAPTTTDSAPEPAALRLQAELALWDAIKDGRSIAGLQEYLSRYPTGQFRSLADERLRAAIAQESALANSSAMPGSSAVPAGPRVGAPRADVRLNSVRWAYIPTDTFDMGCTEGDAECDRDESPRHRVNLQAFEMMTTELTTEHARLLRRLPPSQPASSGPNHPAINVSWSAAQSLCEALGARLPTEAEWEFAARGGVATQSNSAGVFPWGSEPPGVVGGTPNGARFDPSGSALPVATFGANGFGLYDMSGNVWEWVADWYGPYNRNEQSEPRGPNSGASRVLRGGSWANTPKELRVSNRYLNAPTSRNGLYGVRCARNVMY